jgi:predicted nucleic acid-binding protein
MKKVFVDTDVVLDLLLEREPFWQQSAALFTLAHRRAVSVHLSAVTFSTLYYFLRKYKGAAQARAKRERTDVKPAGCKSNGYCSTSGCNKLDVFDWLAGSM